MDSLKRQFRTMVRGAQSLVLAYIGLDNGLFVTFNRPWCLRCRGDRRSQADGCQLCPPVVRRGSRPNSLFSCPIFLIPPVLRFQVSVMTDLFRPVANKGKVWRSLSFFGDLWRGMA